ncbi:MAG: 1-phosphofructokinase [Deltaproteobacteria bacterium]|nr:1-phosphofructokinase [Deltaproteobacteria bacterium]
MIYTLTLNPALDYSVTVPDLRLGATNRVAANEIQWGGKGVNVSRVALEFGLKTVAMGFVAGFTGKALEEGLKSLGVAVDLTWLRAGDTRVNIKLLAQEETEINALGPPVEPEAITALIAKLSVIKAGDWLVLAGNVPPTVPVDIYQRIMAQLADQDVKIALDTSGEPLGLALPKRPYVIKPNSQELRDLVGLTVDSESDIVHSAQKAQSLGARNVLVSMAKEGSILLTESQEVFRVWPVIGQAKNSAGAGDSLLTGFLAGRVAGLSWAESLRLGAAAGSATAFSPTLATKKEIEALAPSVKVSDLTKNYY